MGGEKRTHKRKNRFHKWMAMALTVAILAGQSHVFVLAEEGAGDAPQTEIFSEGTGPDTAGGSNTDTGDVENTGEQQDDGNGQDKCTCETVCTENAVNTNCSVCVADYAACAGKADDTENNDTENNDTENNDQNGDGIENPEGTPEVNQERQEQCVCETACTEDAVNGECPVCAADYVNCVGIEVEEIQNETVLENELIEEADISLLAVEEDGVEAYAVGDKFTYNGLQYMIKGDSEVELCMQGVGAVSGDVVIPEICDKDGVIYSVTSIGTSAFLHCKNLTSVKIPKSIKSIGASAFLGCETLTRVEIPKGVTSIEENVFFGCSSLSEVEIPDSVMSIGDSAFNSCISLVEIKIPNSVASIGDFAFSNCKSLTRAEIPDSVTSIGEYAFSSCEGLASLEISNSITHIERSAFAYCHKLGSVEIPKSVTSIGNSAFRDGLILSSVTIPNSVTSIEELAFYWCLGLKEMRIVVPSDEKPQLTTIEVGRVAFDATPSERSIVFLAEDGSELTGPLLEKAKRAYIEAGKNDDDPDDGKWYGWSVGELSETVDTYTVTINVKKDGQMWSDHGRTFALLPNGGDRFLTDLTQIPNGNYRIYDLTGVNPDSYYSRAVDLGVTVTVKDGNTGVVVEVNGGDPEAKDIDYYTVTFYDGTVPYGAETPQGPQIVLNGKTAARPEDPKKTDYQFAGWKTENGGSTPYDFENDNADQAVPKITSIYASWKAGASGPGSGDNPDPGGDSGTGDNPNPGGDGGTGDNSGPADGSSTGGAADSGDGGAGNEEMTVVSEMASPQAGSGADGTSAGDNADPAGNQAAGGTVAGASGAVADTPEQAANGKGTAANKTEPKTGDATPVEIYATVAMIAGLTYLLLYFMEEGRGMTEREKEVFVAAFIRWGKKGGAFRRGCAVVAIFCLLAYYHSIGKRAGGAIIHKDILKQA